MPTYAIGDLQGCCSEFESLLEIISFNPVNDTLWLVGDLVNRGPQSLETLRLVRSMGASVICVLGNHDLHLLAAYCEVRKPSRGDTLAEVIAAPDAKELIDWLRTRPLAHRAKVGSTRYLMVHAGVVPQWDTDAACTHARELEDALAAPNWRGFISVMYGNQPDLWRDELKGEERLRCIVNILTRLRYCTKEGRMDFIANQGLEAAPANLYPWFDVRDRAADEATVIITGHWSTLGLHLTGDHIGTDTGCVWGGRLTAVRLEDRAIFSLPCPMYETPGAKA